MEGEYFQIFATPRTGTHLSALRRCALQPWQRRSSDARRDASRNIAGARRRGCACARKGGIAAGRPGGPVVVVGHGRGVEDGVAGPWAAGEAGWLGEACGSDAAAAATFGGEVYFVLCDKWLDEVRLKQKLRIFWQKCRKNESFFINSLTSRNN